MRFVLACMVLLIGIQGTECQGQEPEFPYHALVVTEGAKVLSGPGEMHYATTSLRQGDVVQVFRHDPGGWCAIRPPKGSFSLVPSSAIEVAGNQVGTVLEEDLQAWVGTAMGSVENPLWQVKLKAGENVRLLGEVSWPDPEGHSTEWFQISAPNGEFRWIHIDDIQLPVQETVGEFDQIDSAGTIQATYIEPQQKSSQQENPVQKTGKGWRPAATPYRPSERTENRLSDALDGGILPQKDSVTQDAPRRVPAEVFEEEPNENGFVTPRIGGRRFGLNVNRQQAGEVGPLPLDPGQQIRQATTLPDRFANADSAFGRSSLNAIGPMGNAKLSPRLQELDLRLSSEVIKLEKEQWELSGISNSIQQVLQTTRDRSEQIAARRLLDKLNNFQKIQANSRRVTSGAGNPPGSYRVAAGNSTGGGGQGANYDAEGWLNELVQQRGSIDPTFVLQDDTGKITHHLQPAPGLNLHRYLRSKIGVVGQRGYHRQLNLDHVVVERLIVLEKLR